MDVRLVGRRHLELSRGSRRHFQTPASHGRFRHPPLLPVHGRVFAQDRLKLSIQYHPNSALILYVSVLTRCHRSFYYSNGTPTVYQQFPRPEVMCVGLTNRPSVQHPSFKYHLSWKRYGASSIDSVYSRRIRRRHRKSRTRKDLSHGARQVRPRTTGE